jgi:hypothetical protein
LQPDLTPEQIAPELISVGAKSIVENAQRLGLEWGLKIATVIDGSDPTAITAIYDGDTSSAPIDMTSMIGTLLFNQRVYVITVPPSGNFIVSQLGKFEARQTLGNTVASVTFTGIPAHLRALKLFYTARADNAVTVQLILVQVNGDSGALYSYEYGQAQNVTLIAVSNSAQTSGGIGLCTGASATSGRYGSGEVTFIGWDSPHSTGLGWTFVSQAIGAAVANFVAQFGGGIYENATPSQPYTSLTIFPQAGNFITGSDFQLEGWPS